MQRGIDFKLLEVRDMATNITVFTFATRSASPTEAYYFRREGYDTYAVLMGRLETAETHADPYKWVDNNTLFAAHKYIAAHFDTLKTGDVIDVAYLNGRRSEPVQTERPPILF